MESIFGQLGTGSGADDLCSELFPFHIVLELGESPKIISTGKALTTWLRQDFAGRPFSDCFTIVRPSTPSLDEVSLKAKKKAVFVLSVVEHFAQLRGQIVLIGSDRAVFLGSPVLRSATNVEQLGLSIADFAPHDATVDLIVLQQFTEMQLTDLKEQAVELTEAHEAKDRLSESAATDPLTGLANRRAFWSRCSTELESNRRVALLFIDVDRFKSVNDVYGHRVGDTVLCTLADRLVATLRPTDLVARLGGDEFAVLLIDVDHRAITAIVERIQSTIPRPVEVDGHACWTSISIGVVTRTADETVDDLIQDADAAMYEGRQFGPGRVTWFADRMRVEREERRMLTEDLEQAIATGAVYPAFQPIVELETGAVRTCEALARWDHPERGFISPDRFIDLAERAALIDRLDDLMLGQALAELVLWHKQDPTFGLQVNVSGRSIGPTLVTRINHALDVFEINPDTLTIEVTESWLIQNETEVAAALHDVAELGVRIHLDDFGTGYSSLAHIHALPISGLKIDRSFVGPAVRSERSRRLIAATIGMARSLELEVVAEGVEDEETAALLTELGCDYAQGYLFAKPGSTEDIKKLLTPATDARQ
jgi:diguanylate cyclase (GGDEF)-like protein